MTETNTETWRRENFGRRLHTALRVFEDQLHARLSVSGFEGIRLSHLQLMRHVDIGGTSISDIAARSGYTKQAAGQQVVDACKRGLLEITESSQDRRFKIVTFTDHGLELIKKSQVFVEEVEKEFSDHVGTDAFTKASDTIARIARLKETRG